VSHCYQGARRYNSIY